MIFAENFFDAVYGKGDGGVSFDGVYGNVYVVPRHIRRAVTSCTYWVRPCDADSSMVAGIIVPEGRSTADYRFNLEEARAGRTWVPDEDE